jgi:hypothetical protein
MSKHEKNDDRKTIDNLRVKNLKVKNGCVQSLKASDINAKNIDTLSLKTQDFTSFNGEITNLKIKNLNGKDVNCQNNFINFSTNIDTVFPPINTESYNPIVWEGLIDEALFTLNDVLIPDVACGRFRNKLIYDFYCLESKCLPETYSGCTGTGYFNVTGTINGNTLIIDEDIDLKKESLSVIGRGVKQNTVITEQTEPNIFRISVSQDLSLSKLLLVSNCPESICPHIPMTIYGTQTIPVARWNNVCHNSQLAYSIVYNLDIINRSIDLSTRVVAILVQIAWIDPLTQNLRVRQIDLSIRQFNPSLAAILGEQMSANILLPTELIQTISSGISTLYRDAAIQLVVFVEDGIELFTPPTPRNINIRQIVQNSSGNFSASYLPDGAKIIVITDSSNIINETDASLSGSENFTVPNGVNTVNITCYGGGGGGGRNGNLSYSGSSLFAIYPGGGGGSGCVSNGNLSVVPGTYTIKFNLGYGGKGGVRLSPNNLEAKNGEITSCRILDSIGNTLFSLQASGGNAGGFPTDRTFWNQSGDGGNGNAGGGGGGVNYQAGTNPRVGNAGAGNNCISGNNTVQDGQPGNSFTGGNGGFDNSGPGGRGGYVGPFDGISTNIRNCGGGGGGGGGFGGGDGGFGDGSITTAGPESTLNGFPGKPNSSAGGGGAGASLALGIKGGDGAGGYIVIKFL